MKTKYSLFLKNIFLSSMAAMIPSKSHASVYDLNKLEAGNETSSISNTVTGKTLTPKLLLKFNDDNSYSVIAHVSHRSHQSHRSHYSSYSTDDYVTPVTTPKHVATKQSTSKNVSTKGHNVEKHWILGDRILKKGMKGPDVRDLIRILARKGYYAKIDTLTNDSVYTHKVEASVKKFQKADSLTPDGIVGIETLNHLKK